MTTLKPIGLRELIWRVKQELLEPDNTQPLFIIGQIELEISFTVEREASGGINFQVIEADTSRTSTEVHAVKVCLDPILSAEEIGKNLTSFQRRKVVEALTREDDRGLKEADSDPTRTNRRLGTQSSIREAEDIP